MRRSLILLWSYVTAALLAACGNEGLVVNVEGLSPEIASLRVRLYRDARTPIGSDRNVSRTLKQFVITDVESGDFTLEVTGLGSERCAIAAGDARISYSRGTLRPTNVTITLAAQRTPLCKVSVQVPVGVVVKSDPAGIDCGGDSAPFCSADFARGSKVSLRSTHRKPYETYPSWTGACNGPGPCVIDVGSAAQTSLTEEPRVCNRDRFCWHNPLPQGNDLKAIWGSSANDVWAVGSVGTVLHFDGKSWRLVDSGTNADLTAIWGRAANNVWAFADDGSAIQFDGVKWSAGSTPSTASCYKLRTASGRDATNLYVGTAMGDLCKTNGSAWRSVSQNLFKDGSGIASLWINPAGAGWLVGEKGQSAELPLGSESWQTKSSLGFTVSAMSNWQDQPRWAVGGGSALWVGQKWQTIPLPMGVGALSAVWSSSTDTAWAAAVGGGFLRWNVTEWKSVPSPNKQTVRSFWGSSESDIWAVGDGGVMLHFDGRSWASLWDDRAEGNPVNAAWGASREEVWFVGGKTSIMKWDGQSIGRIPTSMSDDLYAIAGTDSSDVWTVGANGLILRRQAGAWEPVVSNTRYWLNSIVLTGPASGWISLSGSLLRLANGISTPQDKLEITPLWLWLSRGKAFASDTNKGICSYDGSKWNAVSAIPMGWTVYSLQPAWTDEDGSMWIPAGARDAMGQNVGVIKTDLSSWNVSLDKIAGGSGCRSVWGRNVRDVWAACSAGVFHTDGTGWKAIPQMASYVTAIWGTAGSIWAIGDKGALLHQAPPN